MINKTLLTFSISAGVALTPISMVHAFVDERTSAASPMMAVESAPTSNASELSGVQLFAVPDTADAGLTPRVPKAVQADLSDSAWKQTYPGPFGQMRLADVLIAHIVPVVGQAITFHGTLSLLDKKIEIAKREPISRIDSLIRIAQLHHIDMTVQGTTVALSETGKGSVMPTAALSDTTAQVGERTWRIDSGVMLSSAMMDWAKQWGWVLIWQADVDYRVAAPIVLTGDFLDTVGQVLDAYKVSARPLWGDFNREQRVLVVREPIAEPRAR